ncbi:hypothetical protein [Pseudoflavitalea rhizosphaerae]|uniref:hypothetical protein n=1 Tax=Pseudoflavitalea rhizosphaerae TaxID=1884793 RepID=UPI000F8E4EC7|nr:hypothetical protein [Pseudoflavitalea rhizosphaerae]
MDSKRFELQESENSPLFREPNYASVELLRQVAASGNIDTATQSVLARNLEEDAKHYRELTTYNKKQLFRYYTRRDWHTLFRVLLIIGYNLACIHFTNGRPDASFMICSNSAIGAAAFRDRLRNLAWLNKWKNQKNGRGNGAD